MRHYEAYRYVSFEALQIDSCEVASCVIRCGIGCGITCGIVSFAIASCVMMSCGIALPWNNILSYGLSWDSCLTLSTPSVSFE